MAISMTHESLGQLSISAGQTVQIGWRLSPGKFPPVVNHCVGFGFDDARHMIRVSSMDHEMDNTPSFFYTATNISAGPAPVVTAQNYIFFKSG